MVVMTPAGTPRRTSSAFTASARRTDRRKLYAAEPDVSVKPVATMRVDPVFLKSSAAVAMIRRASGVSVALFQSKNTRNFFISWRRGRRRWSRHRLRRHRRRRHGFGLREELIGRSHFLRKAGGRQQERAGHGNDISTHAEILLL